MTVEIKSPARPSTLTRLELAALYERYADLFWMIVLALVAIEYALHYNIFLQAIPHDTTFHIYAAQQILDGHAIYRDVAIIKAPLSDFVTALALVGGRLFGISDIMSSRLMSLLVVAASTSVTYLAARVMFRSRAVGLLAGIIMAGWDFYGLRAVTGPEPKAFLILFSMVTLVCFAQKRWLLAGIAAALTTLAWQPGLMLAAIGVALAFVEPFLPLPGGWQDSAPRKARLRVGIRQAAWVLVGILIPFGLLLVYLVANDAVRAAWNATIGANVNHLTSTEAKTPLALLMQDNFNSVLSYGSQYCFSPLEDWLVIGGLVGFAGLVAAQVVGAVRAKQLPVDLDRTPLIIYTVGFAAFTLIDFDFCPDLFPFLPILAIGVAWLLVSAAVLLGKAVGRITTPTNARIVQVVAVGVIALWLTNVYVLDVRAYTVRGVTFHDQEQVVATAKTYLAPGDRVLSFGDAIVPVELHLENAHKILHLGSKSGIGVLESEPGGVQGMIDALDHNPPKLITLSRESKPDWTKPFYDWLAQRYVAGQVFPRTNIRFFVLKP